jgi:hypothetical protein
VVEERLEVVGRPLALVHMGFKKAVVLTNHGV